MNKTQEILTWYKHCIETGSMCCATQSGYMKDYPMQYNDAIQMYNKERIDAMFPKVSEL